MPALLYATARDPLDDRHGVLARGAVLDALLTPELEIVATFVAGRTIQGEDALASRFANLDGDPR